MDLQYVDKYPDHDALIELLKQIGDIERIASKLAIEKISPRELLQLRKSLDLLPDIRLLLDESGQQSLMDLSEKIQLCTGLKDEIAKYIELNFEVPVVIESINSIKIRLKDNVTGYTLIISILNRLNRFD